jgi:hypothetical protein
MCQLRKLMEVGEIATIDRRSTLWTTVISLCYEIVTCQRDSEIKVVFKPSKIKGE